MTSKSNPGNGPRATTEHARTKETQTLVERGKDHPAGPGVTIIRTYEGKR